MMAIYRLTVGQQQSLQNIICVSLCQARWIISSIPLQQINFTMFLQQEQNIFLTYSIFIKDLRIQKNAQNFVQQSFQSLFIELTMYGSNNIFSRNNSSSSQSYNYSSSSPSYNRNTTQKLGSYRTQYKFDEPPSHLTAVIQNWKITPPLSITARQEVLHLTPTEVRVEDYYMIRKKMLKSNHEDKLRDAIRSNCFNEALMKNQCYNLLPFSRDRPYDFDAIKTMARKTDGYNSSNSYSYNNSYSSGGQNNSSTYMRNSGSNIFNSSSNNNTNGNNNNNNSSNNNYGNNSANIFGRNNTNGNSGSNNMSNSNIFGRNGSSNMSNSSNNNVFGQNQSNNNNSYGGNNNSNILNGGNNSGNNIFGQNNVNNNSNNSNNNNNSNIFNRGGSNSNNGGNIFGGNNNSGNIFANGNNNNNNRGNNIFGGNRGNNIFGNQNGNNNYNNGGNNNGGNNIFGSNNQNNGYNQNNMPNNFVGPEVIQELTKTMKTFSELMKQVKTGDSTDYYQNPNKKANNSNNLFSEPLSYDNSFYDISEKMRRKRKQQQEVYVKFEVSQASKKNNITRSRIDDSEHNRLSYFEQSQPFNGSRITQGISHINTSNFRNHDFNEADAGKSQKFSNNGSQKIELARSKSIWQSYNQPCILQIELTINWIDWNQNKGIMQYKSINQTVQCEQMKPNEKKWLQYLVNTLKYKNPIVRSDATIQISYLQNKSSRNPPIFSLSGVISQKIINLDRYQIQYRNVKKDCIFKLHIKNKQGEVRWQKPIKFLQLDCKAFQQMEFTLEENQISCNVPQLNDKCVVCFNKLPDKVRSKMGQDNNSKIQAFNYFSSKIEAKANGNFQLVDIWRDDNTGDEGWQIIVHRFF